MAREDLHFRLRLPEDLKVRVEEAAQRNRRSMTAEIVHRLEHSFREEAALVAIENRFANQGTDMIAEAEDAIARLNAVIAELRTQAQK